MLPLVDVMPFARMIATREAHTPDDVDDLVQVALFAYHKALVRQRKERFSVQNPRAFAATTCCRAIRGYYHAQREWQGRGEPNKALALDDVVLPSDGQQVEMFELQDYFSALERDCGARARLIVENLIMPFGDCSAKILEEVRRKQQLQQACRRKRERRHQPRGVKRTIRLSPRVVRDALGITPTEWTRTMRTVRDFTRGWLAKT